MSRANGQTSKGVAHAIYGGALDASKIGKALRRWRSTALNADVAAAHAVHVGDSITAGYGLLTEQTWVRRLQTNLRAQYPSAAVGGAGYFSVIQNIITPSDWPVTRTGGSPTPTDGLGKKGLTISDGLPATITFVSPVATSIDIHYLKTPSSGSFTYALDGGAPVTVIATAANAGFQKTRITGLGGTSHTIVINNLSGLVIIDGFKIYNGDETVGIHCWESGRSSVTATTLEDTTGSFWIDAFNVIQPSLVTIELGANDAFGVNPPNSVTAFKTALSSLITKIRAKITISPSIVIIPVWQISPAGGVTPIAPWEDYVSAMREIAEADDLICLWDPRPLFRFDTPASTADGLLGDTTHPSALGSRLFGDALSKFLIS